MAPCRMLSEAPGLVCSPPEAAPVRRALGAGPLLATPGIRDPEAAVERLVEAMAAADAPRA